VKIVFLIKNYEKGEGQSLPLSSWTVRHAAFLVYVHVRIIWRADEQRVHVVVQFVGMDVIRVRAAYERIVVASREVIQEISPVTPPEGRKKVACFFVFIRYMFDWNRRVVEFLEFVVHDISAPFMYD